MTSNNHASLVIDWVEHDYPYGENGLIRSGTEAATFAWSVNTEGQEDPAAYLARTFSPLKPELSFHTLPPRQKSCHLAQGMFLKTDDECKNRFRKNLVLGMVEAKTEQRSSGSENRRYLRGMWFLFDPDHFFAYWKDLRFLASLTKLLTTHGTRPGETGGPRPPLVLSLTDTPDKATLNRHAVTLSQGKATVAQFHNSLDMSLLMATLIHTVFREHHGDQEHITKVLNGGLCVACDMEPRFTPAFLLTIPAQPVPAPSLPQQPIPEEEPAFEEPIDMDTGDMTRPRVGKVYPRSDDPGRKEIPREIMSQASTWTSDAPRQRQRRQSPTPPPPPDPVCASRGATGNTTYFLMLLQILTVLILLAQIAINRTPSPTPPEVVQPAPEAKVAPADAKPSGSATTIVTLVSDRHDSDLLVPVNVQGVGRAYLLPYQSFQMLEAYPAYRPLGATRRLLKEMAAAPGATPLVVFGLADYRSDVVAECAGNRSSGLIRAEKFAALVRALGTNARAEGAGCDLSFFNRLQPEDGSEPPPTGIFPLEARSTQARGLLVTDGRLASLITSQLTPCPSPASPDGQKTVKVREPAKAPVQRGKSNLKKPVVSPPGTVAPPENTGDKAATSPSPTPGKDRKPPKQKDQESGDHPTETKDHSKNDQSKTQKPTPTEPSREADDNTSE